MIKELRDNEGYKYIYIRIYTIYTRYFDVYCLFVPTFHYPHVVELILAQRLSCKKSTLVVPD